MEFPSPSQPGTFFLFQEQPTTAATVGRGRRSFRAGCGGDVGSGEEVVQQLLGGDKVISGGFGRVRMLGLFGDKHGKKHGNDGKMLGKSLRFNENGDRL